MIRIFLSVCFLFMFNALAVAGVDSSSTNVPSIFSNGTLAITVNSAPAVGLPAPKIVVMLGFISVYQNAVNWGDTWNLTLPSGSYRIHPLPVSNGTNLYMANSSYVFVPPNNTASKLITYN